MYVEEAPKPNHKERQCPKAHRIGGDSMKLNYNGHKNYKVKNEGSKCSHLTSWEAKLMPAKKVQKKRATGKGSHWILGFPPPNYVLVVDAGYAGAEFSPRGDDLLRLNHSASWFFWSKQQIVTWKIQAEPGVPKVTRRQRQMPMTFSTSPLSSTCTNFTRQRGKYLNFWSYWIF